MKFWFRIFYGNVFFFIILLPKTNFTPSKITMGIGVLQTNVCEYILQIFCFDEYRLEVNDCAKFVQEYIFLLKNLIKLTLNYRIKLYINIHFIIRIRKGRKKTTNAFYYIPKPSVLFHRSDQFQSQNWLGVTRIRRFNSINYADFNWYVAECICLNKLNSYVFPDIALQVFRKVILSDAITMKFLRRMIKAPNITNN